MKRIITVIARTAVAVFPPNMKKSTTTPRKVMALAAGHVPANPPIGDGRTRRVSTFIPPSKVLDAINDKLIKLHGGVNPS